MNENENTSFISTNIVRFVLFVLFLTFAFLISYGIYALSIPLGISLLLAFLLTPIVDFIEGLGIIRIVSVGITLALLVLVFYIILQLLVPPLIEDVNTIVSQSETMKAKAGIMMHDIKSFTKSFLPEGAIEKLDLNYILGFVIKGLESFSKQILETIPDILTQTIITVIMLFIFLLEGDSIYNTLLNMVPNRFFEMTLLLLNKIKLQISGYLKGLITQWSILLFIMGGGFIVTGLSYAPILGIWAATANLIPYVGPMIGILPAIVISLIEPEGGMILKTLMIFGIAQLVDNAYTQPVILARSVKIHPLLAVLSFITFQQLLGVVGMLIAVPATGILLLSITVMYRSLKAFRLI